MKNLFFFIFIIVSFKINGQTAVPSSKFALGFKTGPLISKLHLKMASYHNEKEDNSEIINKIDLQLKPNFGWGFGLFSDIRLFKNLHYTPEVSFKFWEDEAIFKLANTYATLYNINAGLYFLPLSFKYLTSRKKAHFDYFLQAGAGFVVLHSSHKSEFNQFQDGILVNNQIYSYEGVSFADRLYNFQPIFFLSPGLSYKINKNLDLIGSLDYFYFPDIAYTSIFISDVPNFDFPFTMSLTNSILNVNVGLKYNFRKKSKIVKKKRKR